MEIGKNIQQCLPYIAAVKLSQTDGIKQMSDQDLICKYSEIMWDLVTTCTYLEEHGGLTWQQDG